jgi:hypothetical protein
MANYSPHGSSAGVLVSNLYDRLQDEEELDCSVFHGSIVCEL